jgi:hypothetical protein
MLISSSLRNALSSAGAGLALLALSACGSQRTGDYPTGSASISIAGGISAGPGRYAFGVPGHVSLWRGRTEEKPCTLEQGDLGPYWDCTSYRNVAAKILSLECAPRGACTKVSFEGDRGTFLSLAEHMRVKVVADFEGQREEREVDLDYVDPVVDLTVAPHGWSAEVASSTNTDLAFAGGDVQVCSTSGTGALTSFDATFEGAALVATKDSQASSPSRACFLVRPPSAGTLTIVSKLVEPARKLRAVTLPIHPLAEITDVQVRDTYCGGDGLHAFAMQGLWALGVAVVVTTEAGRGLMPGYAIRAEGSKTTPKRTTPDGLLNAFFSTSDTEGSLTLVVDNGARTWTFPVALVSKCPPRSP